MATYAVTLCITATVRADDQANAEAMALKALSDQLDQHGGLCGDDDAYVWLRGAEQADA